MSLRVIATTAAFVASVWAGSASATSFIFSYASNDGLEGAFGTLVATDEGGGVYDATSGTITAFGPVSSGYGVLIANPAAPSSSSSPSGFFTYDDLVEPAQNPLITHSGLLFEIGGHEVNIFSNGPGPLTYQLYSNTGANDFGNFALADPPVPEPATWALMLVGVFATGVVLRKSRERTASA